jgi:trans-aconitate methyltransferase
LITHFDNYAQDYEQTLNSGLKVSGEDSAFFATQRINETEKAVRKLAPQCGRDKVIDFGCGIGASSGILRQTLAFKTLQGLDVSKESLAVANGRFDDSCFQFETIASCAPSADTDLVYCNGVFHHIAPEKRQDSLAYIYQALKVGGIFAFWENNPWNPGVHYVMRAIPFDSDAQMIFPHTALRSLRAAGFRILRLRFFFIFPKTLVVFRFCEPVLSALPLGAQYQIIAIKDAP